MDIVLKLIFSYLVGSLSGSMILGKIKKIDIRKMGSGNAGATNALRTMGILFSIGVLFIDILKGYIAVKYIPKIGFSSNLYNNLDILMYICAIGVILGHVYPIFFNFNGGKGVGSMVGVLYVIDSQCLYICLIMWLITLILTGYVGLSTIIASLTLPLFISIFYVNGITSYFGLFSVIISLFLIFNHRSNIMRLITGNEHRFNRIMIFKK